MERPAAYPIAQEIDMYNERDYPGTGDEATWPVYSGYPNDPRDPGPTGYDAMEFEQRTAYAVQQLQRGGTASDALVEALVDELDEYQLRQVVITILASQDPRLAGIQETLLNEASDELADAFSADAEDFANRALESLYESRAT